MGVEGKVRNLATRIGKQDLLAHSKHEERGPTCELVHRQRTVLKLIGKERELEDGSSNQVGEHRHEAGKVDEVPHRLRIATIDVDDVAERLEGVEADTERQDDPEERIPLQVRGSNRNKRAVVAVQEEVEVLEEPQHQEVRHDRHHERRLLTLRPWPCFQFQEFGFPVPPEPPRVVGDDEAEKPVQERGPEHEKDEFRIRPAVENVA